jgi:sulfite oxidase
MAAGKSIAPFWDLFNVHKDSAFAKQLLETYKIGELADGEEEDMSGAVGILSATSVKSSSTTAKPKEENMMISPDLKVLSSQPLNAETPANGLVPYLTPNSLFYKRSHAPIPQIEDYVLEVNIPVNPSATKDGQSTRSISLTIEDLKKLPKVEVVASLQCAGNRRLELYEGLNPAKTNPDGTPSGEREVSFPVNGLKWQNGAISNAVWGGVLLRDVLKLAGWKETSSNTVTDPKDMHVCFDGYDNYSVSIPLRKAVSTEGDTLLAYEMNREPLPDLHGAPVRVVVPGHVAARSVKWVKKIQVSLDSCRYPIMKALVFSSKKTTE